MSDNDENVEQITKTPSTVPKKEKDPKRVAAGKKLAERNKQMREEYARYKAEQAEREAHALETTEPETEGSGWLPKLSLTNVISLVGIGLTVYNIFIRSREKPPSNNTEPWHEPVHTTLTSKAPSFGM